MNATLSSSSFSSKLRGFWVVRCFNKPLYKCLQCSSRGLTLQREPDWAFVAHRSVDQPVTTQFGVGSFFRHWHSLYDSLYHLQAQSHGIQLLVRVIRTLCWGPNRWRSWWSPGWLHQAGSAAARWARLRRHRLRSAVACPGASSVFIRWRFSRCEILRLRRQNNSRW